MTNCPITVLDAFAALETVSVLRHSSIHVFVEDETYYVSCLGRHWYSIDTGYVAGESNIYANPCRGLQRGN